MNIDGLKRMRIGLATASIDGDKVLPFLTAGIEALEKCIPQPVEEWHEDYGDCLFWAHPIEEAPYCGSPLDDEWKENDYGSY